MAAPAGALGADVEALERLGGTFEQRAGTIDDLITHISNQLQETWWQGQDANSFRSEWSGTHTTALRNVAEQLRVAGQSCRTQATQQRQTSGS